MDRMACVELPAFPLQLLLQRHPDWAGRPVAVVDRDKPQGVILWVNEHARACRIRTGMRYGAGLSLARTLHAGEVPPAEVDRGVAALADRLRRFSPDIEPSRDEPGIFWLNASGLSHLYASPRRWADAVVDAVQAGGFRASVAVGFTRFGTYAIARTATAASGRPVTVLRDAAAERVLAGEAPLEGLGLDPALRDSLQKLGIETLRAFLRLPPAGVRRRFGPGAERLHRLAAGDLWVPLQPLRVRDPLVARHDFDDPETDVSRLIFAVERLLNRLLALLAARHEMLGALTLHLRLDRAGTRSEQIRPAAPTLDAAQLLGLTRLRLEALALDSGVVELRVTARAVRTAAAQQGLFVERPPRDLAAANRALARVRAEFGDGVVVRARLAEAHLPEAQFAWEPLESAPRPAPTPRLALASRSASAPRPVAAPRSAAGDVDCRPLVRRIHARPIPLPPRPRHEPDGWLLRGGVTGHVEDLAGPYLVSGGWWRSAVHREYYFARMRDGDLLWIYYDRLRRRWWWQGRVE
ncbi:MAG: DNA polymerase Y family protein [Acidobacteria bacterium]|nr:DNA polymerase Y family protein [Acidobacteriota bacterium]